MPRKTNDPRKVALNDRIEKCRADFEKWYARARRAFTRMDKTKRTIVRLQRQLARLDGQSPSA
jgi:hypothetical protein